MTSPAQLERQALCGTLLRVGPDAPTLCDPWLARDLAAHIVLRDGRPDATAGRYLGRLVPPLRRHLRSTQERYAALPYAALVDRVRSGPPPWSPVRVPALDTALNTGEMFLHHEDVLRAAPGWTARELSAELAAELWRTSVRFGRLILRGSPTGVTLTAPGHGSAELRRPTSHGTVELIGTPGELSLYLSGRQRVAEVVLDGRPDAAAAFAASPLGRV